MFYGIDCNYVKLTAMKIVIDGRTIPTSSGRYIERMLDGLQEIDSDNEYVVMIRQKGDWKATADNFTAQVAPHADFSFAEQLGLAWQIYRARPDVVHYPAIQHPLLSPRPLVITMQDFTLFDYPDKTNKFLKFLVKMPVFRFVVWHGLFSAKQVISLTKYGKNDILERYPKLSAKKITTIYEAGEAISETTEAYPEFEEKIGGKFIMYVGQAFHHKNLRRLMQAHQQLIQQHPELKLVIVGSLDEKKQRLQQMADSEGYKNIVFTGFVSDEQLSWLYTKAEAYVFPSLSEGFGLPGLEAVHHGCPVVSSNATCLPEVYGSAAQYFDPKNVTDMAKTINSVLTDDRLREGLVESGRQQAAKYSWTQTAKQTLEVYNKAAS